jgi:hypothetical protein
MTAGPDMGRIQILSAGLPHKVDQTTFGHGTGNCFAACVASILGLELDAVPFFMDHGDEWLQAFREWLKPRGLWPLSVHCDDPSLLSGWVLVGGHNPRYPDDPDKLHSVVYYNGDLWHDPHPSREGLLSVSDYTVLIPLAPPQVNPSLQVNEGPPGKGRERCGVCDAPTRWWYKFRNLPLCRPCARGGLQCVAERADRRIRRRVAVDGQ